MSLTDWHHRDPRLVLMILLSHQKGSPLSWSEAQTDHHLVVAGQGHWGQCEHCDGRCCLLPTTVVHEAQQIS